MYVVQAGVICRLSCRTIVRIDPEIDILNGQTSSINGNGEDKIGGPSPGTLNLAQVIDADGLAVVILYGPNACIIGNRCVYRIAE